MTSAIDVRGITKIYNPDTARAFKDGHIFHVITRGQKKMPHYGDVLVPSERWDIVAYVRAMQKAQKMANEGKQ